jgi:hypothetical protein
MWIVSNGSVGAPTIISSIFESAMRAPALRVDARDRQLMLCRQRASIYITQQCCDGTMACTAAPGD